MVMKKGVIKPHYLKTPEERLEAFKQYCEHVAAGWPVLSFVSTGLKKNIAGEGMETYLKNFAHELPMEMLEHARAKRFQHWLGEGVKLMRGGYQHGSPVVWQTMMRNMFKSIGWDQFDSKPPEGPTESSKLTIAKMKELNAGNYTESKASSKLSRSNFED